MSGRPLGRAEARLLRLAAFLGCLAFVGILSPHLPPRAMTRWLVAAAGAALVDALVVETFVRRAISEGRHGAAKFAHGLTQCLIALCLASFGFWAWSPYNDEINCLVLAAMFVLCLRRIIPRPELGSAQWLISMPPFAILILAPWIGGSKIAAELTLLSMAALVYLSMVGERLRGAMQTIGTLQIEKQQAEAKAAQSALTQFKSEAEAARRARQTLLDTLDAEARGPLATLRGLTAALKEDSSGNLSDGRYRDYAAEVHSYCVQFQDFAEDIVDLARIDNDALTLKTSCLDLSQVLNEVTRDCAVRLHDSQIALEVITFSELPKLLADERLVRRMVVTLVAAALRQTAPGGQITITVPRLPDGGLGLRVSSTGSGLSEADLERVYESLVSGTTEQLADEKSGLGMMIVKGLIERHGGSLSIRNRLGVGRQATINFPPERLISNGPLLRFIDAA
jgi:signal transduction histidine kinase